MFRNNEEQKEWYLKNKESILKKRRERYKIIGEKSRVSRRAWGKKNKDWLRDYELKRRYGISLVEWNTLFEKQCFSCAICGSAEPKSKRGWHTDHDHKNNKVRGILCATCNRILPEDADVEVLYHAIEYLQGERCF